MLKYDSISFSSHLYIYACKHMCSHMPHSVCACECMLRYVHMNAGAIRYQKKALHPLKLELEIVVNHLM